MYPYLPNYNSNSGNDIDDQNNDFGHAACSSNTLEADNNQQLDQYQLIYSDLTDLLDIDLLPDSPTDFSALEGLLDDVDKLTEIAAEDVIPSLGEIAAEDVIPSLTEITAEDVIPSLAEITAEDVISSLAEITAEDHISPLGEIAAEDVDPIPSINMSATETIANDNEYVSFIEQPSSSRGIKRQYTDIEEWKNKKHSDGSGECCDTYYMVENYFPMSEQCHLSNQEEGDPRSRTEHVMPEELQLVPKLYRHHNLSSTRLGASIYEHAIDTIDVDEREIFKNYLLEELEELIKEKDIEASSIDVYHIYSSVRKYIAEKISPHINDIIRRTADILITPEMSISHIKYKCTSNYHFLDMLSKCCIDIAKDIDKLDCNTFSAMVKSRIIFGQGKVIWVKGRKDIFSQALKNLVVKTMYDLPHKILHAIEKLTEDEIHNCTFSFVHGVLISKSLIRSTNYIIDSIKEEIKKDEPVKDRFEDYKELLDESSQKLEEAVSKSVILYKKKILFLNKSTSELMIKHLLAGINNVCFNFYSQLYNETQGSTSKESSVSDITTEVELSLPKKTITTRKKSSSTVWDPYSISQYTELYKLAITMIKIDMEDFKKLLIDESNNKISVRRCINKISFNPNLDDMCSRIRCYIADKLDPLLSRIGEEEIKSEIKIHEGLIIEQFKLAYSSGGTLYHKFNKLCSEVVSFTQSCKDEVLLDMIPRSIRLESGVKKPRRMELSMKRKQGLIESIRKLVMNNISSIPESISDIIESMPISDVVAGFFSFFYKIYVDNGSLLKARKVFELTKEKIMNDEVLTGSETVNKISKSINLFACSNKLNNLYDLNKPINYFIVEGGLSASKYLKKLIRSQFCELEKELSGPIMIIQDGNVSIANKETREYILSGLKTSLMAISIKSYKEFCLDKSGIFMK